MHEDTFPLDVNILSSSRNERGVMSWSVHGHLMGGMAAVSCITVPQVLSALDQGAYLPLQAANVFPKVRLEGSDPGGIRSEWGQGVKREKGCKFVCFTLMVN